MTRRHRILLAAAAAAAAASLAVAAPAHAAATCGGGTYSYAGFTGAADVDGVSATIAQAGPLDVHAGHVAGWIGIVDPSAGNAWLQVGLSALPGETTSAVYVEFRRPGHAPVLHRFGGAIAVADPHSFALTEQPWTPGTWVVWIDGHAAGEPIHLPGSHNHWRAQILGESWAGTSTGSCNAYSYAFSQVRLRHRFHPATGLRGALTADPNYAIAEPSTSGFVATSFGVAGFRGTAQVTQVGQRLRPAGSSH